MKTFVKSYRLMIIYTLILSCTMVSACKKFIDVNAPTGQLTTENIYINDNTVKSALAGIYSSFAITSSTSLQSYLSLATGCSADEVTTVASTYEPFLNHAIPTDDAVNNSMWTRLYTVIYQANAIIEGVNNSTGGLSQAMKDQAIAEAKFLRAFCYFHLVNLWGDVPLALTTSRPVNTTLFRSPKAEVYDQIIKDLKDAELLLPADFSYGGGQRIRASKYAAIAMLSRVYLYTEDWANAEANATTIINNTTTFGLLTGNALAGIFVKNNTEAIFQLDAPNSGISNDGYTTEALNNPANSTVVPQFQLTPELTAAFETTPLVDRRFTNWVGVSNAAGGPYYYNFKFKNRVANTTATGEYVTYLRLAELYLIRAEARAKQNNLTAAISDINVIRGRANIGNTNASGQPAILLAIEQERRVEFFCEYAQRWYDLKRTGRANAVLAAKTNWNANSTLYPIPKNDLLSNSNLTPNPGYN